MTTIFYFALKIHEVFHLAKSVNFIAPYIKKLYFFECKIIQYNLDYPALYHKSLD